ncbi:MAG TPA: Sua5/YciO/YrdC/YwlC family protein, partial [Gemmatimonadaceae bacterium]|nr:Sua5/YciO/YrdC/YwlC family protein [Gemmatimonadaceae bacterium]
MTVVRRRVQVRGVVQGVGFRPFAHALARRLGVAGHVGNDDAGVFLEVEGDEGRVLAFLEALQGEAPPLARVEAVVVTSLPPRDEHGFHILASRAPGPQVTPVSPDVAPCDDCLRDLRDSGDRRFRYPFVNCTNCGPRYTIVRDVPYDRAMTTMAGFVMCEACRREYDDPGNRRFHAQPNACPSCGPQLVWRIGDERGKEARARADSALQAALAMLRDGGIVAVKGIGGYHLACDAMRDDVVARLRERKQRSDKPFALLAASLDTVRRFAIVPEAEARLLSAGARPIVLLDRRPDAELAIAESVAPGLGSLGVMLPPSPLHVLLADVGPLVLTSGNLSEEPIAREDDEALARLSSIADGFLQHDRAIHVVCDDSVVRWHDGGELPLRRSRGY